MRKAKDGERQNGFRSRVTDTIRGATIAVAAGALVEVALAPSVQAGIEFKSFQTHSHIKVAADPSVVHTIERIEQNGRLVGLRMVLMNSSDPLENLVVSGDPRTKIVRSSRGTGVAEKVAVYEIYFSDEALSRGIEFFDFRNKSPSEITLDYWYKTLSPQASVKIAAKKSKVDQVGTKKHRQVASVKKNHAVIGESAKCMLPLDTKVSGGLNFKVYHSNFDYKGYFHLDPADSEYQFPYEKITDGGDDVVQDKKELAHYRLALKLYRSSQYALVLRTVEFFRLKYPKSILSGELDLLEAGTFIKLSKMLKAEQYQEKGYEAYRRIYFAVPETKRGKLALAYLVQEKITGASPIAGLELALIGAGIEKSNPHQAIYRLAVAEALYSIGEYDRAERSYQALIDMKNEYSAEAHFKIGEVFSARNFYERALIAYEKAIRTYPNESLKYASAYLNLAEAYYRVGRFAESRRVYNDFLEKFPSDAMAWAADYRLAELAQILEVDATATQLLSNYERVINRHPYAPGAFLSELRISACYEGLSDGNRVRSFFTNFFDTKDLTKLESPIIDAGEMKQWVDLAEADFYSKNGEYRKALIVADEYRSKIDKFKAGLTMRKAYERAVIGLVAELAREGKADEVLGVVEHYGDFVHTPGPVGYVLSIAKAHEIKGNLEKLGEQLKVVELRLAEASDDQRDWYFLSSSKLKMVLAGAREKVTQDLVRIHDSGPFALEKYEQLALLARRNGDQRAAVDADRRWLELALKRTTAPERRLAVELQKLEAESYFVPAAERAKTADQLLLKYGTVTEKIDAIDRIREIRAQALYDANDYRGSVEAFNELISAKPDHPRLTEFEFLRGKALARLGREGEALETFRKLAGGSVNDVWKKSAQTELDQLQWENNISNQLKEKDRRSSQ